jgi:hypothetical protein
VPDHFGQKDCGGIYKEERERKKDDIVVDVATSPSHSLLMMVIGADYDNAGVAVAARRAKNALASVSSVAEGWYPLDGG